MFIAPFISFTQAEDLTVLPLLYHYVYILEHVPLLLKYMQQECYLFCVVGVMDSNEVLICLIQR